MDGKGRRFVRKVMTGVDCRNGQILRCFVLTESDEAISLGLDFALKFKHLIAFLRKRYGDFQYVWINHLQGKKERHNYHVMYYGSYIGQGVIDDWWMANYASHRSKMEEIHNPAHMARYLAKYLQGNAYQGSHFSSGWVFVGWWEFSKWLKSQWGEYPGIAFLKKYHFMSPEELKNDKWYGNFLVWKEEDKRKGSIVGGKRR
jgi:hypothetical protein